MLKLKELEDLLNEGYFDYQSYVEMHGGPHDFVLYDKRGKPYEDKNVKGWLKLGNLYYSFVPHCHDNSEDRPDSVVEYLEIYRRGEKVINPLKVQRRTGQTFHWTSTSLFQGRLESLEELKKLLKQVGIDYEKS